jgi:voltage-gated sodium channel
VVATNLFGADFPEVFGSLGDSAFTLFQVMTLESWSEGVTRPIMEKIPNAWIFFILFIFIATFIVINLFIAVIVDSLNNLDVAPREPALPVKELHSEINALRLQLAEQDKHLRELTEWIKSQGTLKA